MKILDVDRFSPLFGRVRPGYTVRSINGEAIEDTVDFRFKTAEERVDIRFADPHGREVAYQFEDWSALDLGLTLDDHKIKFCKNDCIFCFVSQQPQGMRRKLYFRDEDYRLSFTHGNFVTLSNTSQADLERIVRQRLSPLYVSVHATDDTLRRCMLRNEFLAPIVPRLRYLGDRGIELHTQVVLCPGVNDGDHLERTIDELAELHPGVRTLAVVPVGLTRHREALPSLRTYTASEAGAIIDYLAKRQRDLLARLGSRFVWAADEFYVAAQRPFPPRSHYEGMHQFENGVGMAREFITNFNRRRHHLKGLSRRRRALFLTGASAFPFFNAQLLPFMRERLKLRVDLDCVANRFWGESVTVSGLLTGQDLLRHARPKLDRYDIVVLPPNCLNNDSLFLDNLSLEQFRQALGVGVVVGQYDMAATLREVFS